MTLEQIEATLAVAAHLAVVAGVGARVILTRHPPGSSFAWLLLVAVLPVVGLVGYLLIGERPIGRRRTAFAKKFFAELPSALRSVPERELAQPDALAPPWDGLARLAARATGMPLAGGSAFTLLDGAETILRAIMADVEAARARIDMEFYIWNPGGLADEVGEALGRAARRGVRVRLLLDALGSKPFFRSPWPRRLRAAGVDVRDALGVKAWKIPFQRIDLRLHRKVVVVDDRVAYTGSMNLVDPRFFKQGAGVGEWVDAMVRAEGPIVGALRAVFLFDWGMQTGLVEPAATPEARAAWAAAGGTQIAQVIMSGPGVEEAANLRVITHAIASARRSVVLTTPYFVADAALALALEGAAMRGCDVTLILPARNDSWLVEYASRWFYDDLARAGVKILQYTGGLLHTKSVTVDESVALFGTVNLDIRSLSLNFELMVAIYDARFAHELLALQRRYAADARPLVLAQWKARSVTERLKEGIAFMAAPLL
ncbi:MAG: cardiolipin synthase [Burkholderiales bacterium]|nr:cardiolipin synthase [Burkholderiales bacterium]